MHLLFREVTIFNRKLSVITIIWFLLALLAVLSELRYDVNNFHIFRGVFWHTIEQRSLYLEYPLEYKDNNHYGPVFSLIIAPFALLPVWLGCLLWCLTNAAILYYAIRSLNLPHQYKLIILAITAVEMMTSTHNVQFNPMLTAFLVFSYVLVEKEKDFWATLFIALGFLIKIYGIAGLLFFVFSRHKWTFIWSFAFWLGVLFCIPMLYSSPEFILKSYPEWIAKLVQKDNKNGNFAMEGDMQDISVMGIIRRTSGRPALSAIPVLVPAALLITLPLLRFRQYAYQGFRLSYLSIVLISVVIFSTAAESATYVVAVTGAAIWYAFNYKHQPRLCNALLIVLFMLCILGMTDLYPHYIKANIIKAYALKALPCTIIWLVLIRDVIKRDFSTLEISTSQH